MWIKRFKDGSEIREDRANGVTWLTTPLDNVSEVALEAPDGQVVTMRTFLEYWHSRGGITSQDGRREDILERVQGRRPDGMWETWTWIQGQGFRQTIDHKAYGKPVKNE